MLNKLKRIFAGESDLKEIITKSSSAMLFRILGLGTNYLFLTYVIFKFGAEGWGIFAICFTILQVSSMIGTLGMDIALVKLFSSDKLDKTNLFINSLKFAIPINLILTALIYWQADFISSYFKDAEGMGAYIQSISLGVLPFSITLIIGGAFRGLKKIKTYTALDSLGRFSMGIIFIFILSFFMNDDGTVILGFIIGLYVLLLIASIVFIKTLKDYSTTVESEYYSPKELLRFSLTLFWNPIANRGISWVTIFLLGYYVSKGDIGIYDTCFRLAGILSIVLFSINSISAPKFAEFNNHKDVEKLKKIVQYTAKLIFYTATPIFIVLISLGWLILDFFGKDFSGQYSVFLFILIGQFIGSLCGSVGFFMQMTGLHIAYRNILIFSLLLNIILGIILIPIYGVVGAAFVIGLTFAVKNLAGVIYIYYKTKIKTFYLPFLS